MKPKFASLLALLLAVAFVSVGTPFADERDYEKAQVAMEQATQGVTEEGAGIKGAGEEQKVEIKGKVEEEKGKTTLEMKEHMPQDVPEEAAAAPGISE